MLTNNIFKNDKMTLFNTDDFKIHRYEVKATLNKELIDRFLNYTNENFRRFGKIWIGEYLGFDEIFYFKSNDQKELI